VLEPGLKEAGTTVNLDLGAVLALARGDVFRDVAGDQGGIAPVQLLERSRGHVLASVVELIGDRAVAIRPVRGEDLVRPAAEQQLVQGWL
jgi:hypothetical protein